MPTLSREREAPLAVAQPASVRAVWIAWERHRRSRELAGSFSAELLEFVSPLRRPWKYFVLIVQTVAALLRRRPAVLIVQCPSVILGVLACVLRSLFRYRLVLDLHNECVQPYNFNGRLYVAILRWMRRSCDVAIVSNDELRKVIAGESARVCVLPDKLPSIESVVTGGAGEAPVVFICTFSPDEPYLQVLEAARLLPDVRIFVTGNFRKATDLPPDLPSNVTFSGFLPEHEYLRLLSRAGAIVDLTSMENCLVCGAYEAAALGKALVTSDTAALRGFFSKGTVYTRHTPEALAAAIQTALQRRAALENEMRAFRSVLETRWQRDFAVARTVILEGA